MDRLKRFLPLILMAGAAALVFGMGWNRYLSLETLQVHGEALQDHVQRNYLIALLVLMAVFALMTASVTPGVFFLTITAGYLFGPWVGGLATAVAATLGALVVYAVARTALGERLRARVRADTGLLSRVCDAIDRETFWYVLATRLAVVVPFHMINVAAGLMSVRVGPYAAATVIGLLPAHIIYCWMGSRLDQLLEADANPDFNDLFVQFWQPLAGVFVLAVILPFVFKAAQRALERRRST